MSHFLLDIFKSAAGYPDHLLLELQGFCTLDQVEYN